MLTCCESERFDRVCILNHMCRWDLLYHEHTINSDAALVLFPGTKRILSCLVWALQRYRHVETLAFDYQQRHAIELEVSETFLSSITDVIPHWSCVGLVRTIAFISLNWPTLARQQ